MQSRCRLINDKKRARLFVPRQRAGDAETLDFSAAECIEAPAQREVSDPKPCQSV
jgi:hypothetical protein